IDFVITDSIGRRVGRNPVLGVTYNEIPDSYYGRDQAVAADDGFDEPPLSNYSRVLADIEGLTSGQYSVQVYGLDSGPWSVDIGVTDPNNAFAFSRSSMSGTATAGSYSQFTFMVYMRGDWNHDGVVDAADVQVMLTAVTDLEAYKTTHALTD